MMREPEKYKAIIGEREYEEEIANCLYGIYQLLGKLSASIYVAACMMMTRCPAFSDSAMSL